MRLTSISRVFFFNTKTTTWDTLRLPSSVDANLLQYKCSFRRKLLNFRSQPAMRGPIGNVHIKFRQNYLFEDSYEEVMRLRHNHL